MNRSILQRAAPWETPKKSDCYFYHFFDLKDGTTVGGPHGAYDIRHRFNEYIGNADLRGKTVFDFGSASGFLSFSAEKAGAKTVTAFDTKTLYHQQRVPFAGEMYLTNKEEWSNLMNPGFQQVHNGFWYIWHEEGSKVGMVYGTEDDLVRCTEVFDVVIAGAVIEHLSDPVTALGLCAKMARETLILAFTPVLDGPEEVMKPLVPWDSAERSYVWWVLSEPLYRRVLGNLGFDIELLDVSATYVGVSGRKFLVRPSLRPAFARSERSRRTRSCRTGPAPPYADLAAVHSSIPAGRRSS